MTSMLSRRKIVVSLFDLTGHMVEPWANAGFLCYCVDWQHAPGVSRKGNIIRVGADVREWLPPYAPVAILFAFPPCTDVAVSGARWFKDKKLGALIQALQNFDASVRLAEWTRAPYFIENGGDMPTALPADVYEHVLDVQADAAAALGVTRGTVKGDIVVHNGQVYVIELAARLSGGFFCTQEIPLNTGVDFIGCAIRVALGENPAPDEMTPKYQKFITQRYIFPDPGTVVATGGGEEAWNVPGVLEVNITAKKGDVIPPAGDKRPSGAMVIATGANRQEARANAAAALSRIQVVTQ